MSRWKASLIHSGLSLVVAAAAIALLIGLWYPPPYFQAGGGDRLLLLVVSVDAILGPLFTLIVFDKRKPELKRDLAIIVLVQVAALVYGVHVMLQSRPVFLVAALDRFVVVAANDLEPNDLAKASRPQWRRLSWTGPVLVAAKLPDSGDQRTNLMFSALAGKDVEKFPAYYIDYEKVAPELLKRGQPISRLRVMHAEHSKKIDAWLQRNNRAADSVVWLPIVARKEDITMLLDHETGQPVGTIGLDPW